MNNTTKAILGISVATAAGAALGILLAPETIPYLKMRMRAGKSNWLHNFSKPLHPGERQASQFRLKERYYNGELTSELLDMEYSTAFKV